MGYGVCVCVRYTIRTHEYAWDFESWNVKEWRMVLYAVAKKNKDRNENEREKKNATHT